MFTKKNLLLLIGRHTLIAGGVVLVALGAITFLSHKITETADAVVKNQTLAKTLAERTALFTTLKRDSEIVGTGDAAIEHAFIPSDNILDFIAGLETLALKNNTTQAFRFETPVVTSIDAPLPLATISFSNSLATNALTFSNYLKEFERLPYFAKIESFTISAQDKTGWRGASTATYRATLYTRSSQ